MSLLIANATDLAGNPFSLRCSDSIIETGASLRPGPGDRVIDAHGGVLLPGLQDHHLHLLSTAASRESLLCGPPEINSVSELLSSLQSLDPKEGILVRVVRPMADGTTQRQVILKQ